jgi:hypothetical protein
MPPWPTGFGHGSPNFPQPPGTISVAPQLTHTSSKVEASEYRVTWLLSKGIAFPLFVIPALASWVSATAGRTELAKTTEECYPVLHGQVADNSLGVLQRFRWQRFAEPAFAVLVADNVWWKVVSHVFQPFCSVTPTVLQHVPPVLR